MRIGRRRFRARGSRWRGRADDQRRCGEPVGRGGNRSAVAARGAAAADRGARDRRGRGARRGPARGPAGRGARSHEFRHIPAQHDGAAGQRLDRDDALRSAQPGRPVDRRGRRRGEPVSALLRTMRRQPGDAVRGGPELRRDLPGPGAARRHHPARYHSERDSVRCVAARGGVWPAPRAAGGSAGAGGSCRGHSARDLAVAGGTDEERPVRGHGLGGRRLRVPPCGTDGSVAVRTGEGPQP